MLTTAQVDEALKAAEDSVSTLGAALFELEGDITRRLLDESTLSGATAAAWGSAGDQTGVVWTWFGALSSHLEACRTRRGSGRLRDRQIDELADALNRPVVVLPPDSLQLAASCLPDLHLVSPAAVRPLLDALTAIQARLADVVARVAAVWDRNLGRLGEIDRVLATATAGAQAAGVRLPNEAAAATRQSAQLREVLRSDPLSFDAAALASLAAAADRVRASVEEASRGRTSLGEELASLGAAVDAAAAAADAATAEHRAAADKIAGLGWPTALAGAGAQLDALRATVADLQAQAGDDWQGAQRGLRAAQGRVADFEGQLHQVAVAAADALARRGELRGRLDGYRAKAQAVGRGEDLALEDRFRAARDCLYTSPCDLDRAAALVAEYQAALRPAPAAPAGGPGPVPEDGRR